MSNADKEKQGDHPPTIALFFVIKDANL